MKYIHLFIYLLFFLIAKTQNLVPNPSFETYTMCPNSGNQIEYAIPWNAATTNSSTDYFNSCASGISGVPYNLGFQYARTGNAYAGLIFYVGTNLREYLQVQLNTAMIPNSVYYVDFYVNLSNVNWSSPCNNIAANFSATRPFTNNFGELQSLIPHIMLQGNPVISDTMNWVQISGCYTAQGGEEYLTIGNFFDNAHTTITGTNTASYYYIDDVRVEEIAGTCVAGIHESSFLSEAVRVYPNPTSDIVNITAPTFTNKDLTTIKLTDITGKEILAIPYKEQINISNLEKGIYLMNIYRNNQLLAFKKIIKL